MVVATVATGGLIILPANDTHEIAGFFFIPEALTKAEQLHWATQSLTNFPQPPNRTNHNAMYGPIADLWAAFLEKKVLVEIGGECDSEIPNELISDNCQRVNEEVSGEGTVAERNRFHDHETTNSGVGNANRLN